MIIQDLLNLRKDELRTMDKEEIIIKYLVVAEMNRQKTELIQNMEQQFKEAGYEDVEAKGEKEMPHEGGAIREELADLCHK